jgi:hypothetical protein
MHRSLLAQSAEKEAGSSSVNVLVWMDVIHVPLKGKNALPIPICSSCQFECTNFLSANANTAHAQCAAQAVMLHGAAPEPHRD